LKHFGYSFSLFIALFLFLNLVPKKFFSIVEGDFYVENFFSGTYQNKFDFNNQCVNKFYNFKLIASTFAANTNHLLLTESDKKITDDCILQIYSESIKNGENIKIILNNSDSEGKSSINATEGKSSINATEGKSSRNITVSKLQFILIDLNKIVEKQNITLNIYRYESPSIFFIFLYSLLVSLFYFFYAKKITHHNWF
jgi:hypothetical protein